MVITKQWNPLLFAIYYGQVEIVSSILKKMNSQHLYYLLSDPFVVEVDVDKNSGGS